MSKQILVLACIFLAGGLYTLQQEKKMAHAKGTFEVKLTPLAKDEKAPAINRISIDKKFQGDLQGTSRGEMLSILTATEGSAGYVAIERVKRNDRWTYRHI